MPPDICRFCGLSQKVGHDLKQVRDWRGHFVTQLVGADDHLFEQAHFPRAPQTVVVECQPFTNRGQQEEENDMTVLQRVQALDTNRATADEMIDLLTSARLVRSTYVEKSLPVPDALVDGVKRLEIEIEVHRKDTLERRRKEILAQRATLESRDDKLRRLNEEMDAIDTALGNKVETPA